MSIHLNGVSRVHCTGTLFVPVNILHTLRLYSSFLFLVTFSTVCRVTTISRHPSIDMNVIALLQNITYDTLSLYEINGIKAR